jgi:hypothetical protein
MSAATLRLHEHIFILVCTGLVTRTGSRHFIWQRVVSRYPLPETIRFDLAIIITNGATHCTLLLIRELVMLLRICLLGGETEDWI